MSPRPVRPVAVVSFAQSKSMRREELSNDVEMLQPVVVDVFEKVGLTKDDMGFVCSGSCDYLVGAPFSFVGALDAVGCWPPMRESHVEMDGAFALYEAWTQLQEGDIDTALVYSFGRSSMSELGRVLTLQLDPYYVAPLWLRSGGPGRPPGPGPSSTPGPTPRPTLAAVAARSRRDARNPNAQVTGDHSPEELLGDDYVVAPLRRHALPPITDGAAAIILAAGDRARDLAERPAWITGMDHRRETHFPRRPRTSRSPSSTRTAGEEAGISNGGRTTVDVAELHAPFAHQELILRDALGLGDGVRINPSGGALAANGVMVAGLARIGEAASRIMDGRSGRNSKPSSAD